MSSQPFYHLRPNKFVDRELFMEVLKSIIGANDLQKCHYYGFGSYYFDDFKALHSQLNIHRMTSLEHDAVTFDRAMFNKPLNCIEVLRETSTEFISNFYIADEGGQRHIFWLDFVEPAKIANQFRDYCDLIPKLGPKDIVRITLNAHVASLGFENRGLAAEERREKRLAELRSRLGDFVPTDCTGKDMTTKNYPIVLLKCLENATLQSLRPSKYQKEFLLPLFATRYADGQQMLTLTGIILDAREQISEIKEAVRRLPFCSCSWGEISNIQIPSLTQKEITAVNEKLPVTEGDRELDSIMKQFSFIFSEAAELKDYAKHYRCYPNFQHVIS